MISTNADVRNDTSCACLEWSAHANSVARCLIIGLLINDATLIIHNGTTNAHQTTLSSISYLIIPAFSLKDYLGLCFPPIIQDLCEFLGDWKKNIFIIQIINIYNL